MNAMDLFDLSGKVAVITGGARTLGYDMALALAEAGADVAITSRELEAARKSAETIAQATGRRTLAVQCDVRFEDQVEKMADAVLAEFGRIDILVNNAGNVTSTPENKPMEQRPTDAWEYTIDVNLKGTFLCTKHVVAKAMKPARQGVIINIASVAGMLGKDHRVYRDTPMGGVTIDYAAAKGGVINMTREMACWLAQYNIRVNSISPGGFWRNHSETFTRQYSYLVPMGRMGQDGKEVKGAALFLASEASSYVTGINLPVDGGMTAW
ncbi:MAG TPA: SDR family oxidoreductase [Candidatus Hydrogenedentes bacterium]|nr:SDR family oxidoreductase [Candidatus Hydrogenedentota bacterium]HPG65565.1 SDR family oxidoreductase [Candidatus Hydrogenedentota bacterium]